MPAIDFPASPAVNDEYSFEGRTWRWNGTGWEVKEYPAALLAGTAANPSLYFSGDPNTGLYSPGADQVAISTGGTGRLFVDASGNVGINTTSGTSYGMNLALVGTLGLIPSTQNTVGSSIAIRSQLGSSGGEDFIKHEITGFANGANYATAISFATRSTTAGVERLRITSTGNVGIGTSAPGTVLDVTDPGTGLRFANAASGNFNIGLLGGTSSAEAYIFQRANSPLILGTNNTERARIDSSGRLLVGTSTARTTFSIAGTGYAPQTQLEGGVLQASFVRAASPYIGLAASNAAASEINVGNVSFFGNDGTNFIRAAEISAVVDGTPGTNDMPGRLVFSTTADGASSPTEAMRINNQRELLIGTTTRTANGGVLQISNGITFPGTQSACSDANTLDDYEEGTWTPTLVGATTAGTGTYTTQSGTYTKIGRQVYITVQLAWTAHTGTGQVRVTGLPFSGASGVAGVPSILADSYAFSANNVPAPFFVGGTIIYLYQLPVGGGAVGDAPFDTAAGINLAMTYTV